MAIQINGDSGISGVNGSAGTPALQGTDSNTGVVFGTDTVQVATGGSTRVTVDSSGNVTATGNVDLGNVNTSSNSNTGSKLETSGQLLLQLSSSVGAGNQNGIAVYYGNALKTTIKNDGSASFAGGAFAIASDGDISTNIRGHGHLELDSTGSFGSPKVKLFGNTGNATFAGDVSCANDKVKLVTSSAHGLIQVKNSSNVVKINIVGSDGSGIFDGNVTSKSTFLNELQSGYSSSDSAFKVFAGGSTFVDIKANGAATFASYNDSSTSGFGVKINIASNAGDVRAQCQSTASQYTRLYDGLKGTSTVFSVLANGNLTVSGNVTAANVSDIRFKENITDANPQLADVVDLGSQLKNWDWKDDAPLNEELRAKRFLGLVAQEAEKVCPGLTYTVPRTKRGKELTAAVLNEDGNETKAATYEKLDDSYKAINHDILVMKLLGAVAEQNTQIETLKARVTTLEAG